MVIRPGVAAGARAAAFGLAVCALSAAAFTFPANGLATVLIALSLLTGLTFLFLGLAVALGRRTFVAAAAAVVSAGALLATAAAAYGVTGHPAVLATALPAAVLTALAARALWKSVPPRVPDHVDDGRTPLPHP